MKTLLKNKYIWCLGAFILGGLIFKMCATEEIRIETKEVVKWKTKVVEVEKEVRIVENVERVKETRPDGTIIEKEIINKETESETSAKEAEASSEFAKSKLVVHKNPKSTLIYGGIGVMPTSIASSPYYTVGVSTKLWGPFNVGIQASGSLRSPAIYGTIGFTF